jgi:hypothetical protein
MKLERWVLTGAFERHGILPEDFRAFARMVNHGKISPKAQETFGHRLATMKRYSKCVEELCKILTVRARTNTDPRS